MRWTCVRLVFTLMVVAGCRSTAPDLRPPKQPEVANSPPAQDRRYDSPNYPKEAFNNNSNNTYDPASKKGAGNANNPMAGGPGGGMMSPGMVPQGTR